MLIDLKNLDSVAVDASSQTAVIGSGNKLAPLYYKLWTQGKFTLPGGTCPTVGIGGLTLGGGFGLLSRQHGLTTDSVVEMRVILANGTTVTANQNQHTDLFWALRGAGGGSFGIVTSFTMRLARVPDLVTSFSYSFPANRYKQVMNAYQTWGPSAVSTVTTELVWSNSAIELVGVFLGPRSALSSALEDFLSLAPSPTWTDIREEELIRSYLRFSWLETTNVADMLKPKASDALYMKGNSLLYSTAISDASVEIMNRYLMNPSASSSASYLIIDLWGGVNSKVGSVPVSETSFVHRNTLFGIEPVVEWRGSAQSPECTTCLNWIDSMMRELVQDYKDVYKTTTVSAYQNYIDEKLPDWEVAYYGSAIGRLKEVKSKYDPTDRFRFPRSIKGKVSNQTTPQITPGALATPQPTPMNQANLTTSVSTLLIAGMLAVFSLL